MEYKCEFCGKTFSTKSNLNTHVKTAKKCIKSREKQIITGKIYSCEYCLKVFTRTNCLQNHLKICLEKIKSDRDIVATKLEKIEKEILTLKTADIELNELKKLHEQLKLENMHLSTKNLKLKEKLKENDGSLKKAKFQLLNQKNEIEKLHKNLSTRESFIEKLTSSERTNPNNNVSNSFNNSFNNCNISVKLSKIVIENSVPLTPELINNKTNTEYLYHHYANGYNALNDFMERIVATDPKELDLNPRKAGINYVCTNPTTDEFYKLNKLKQWEQDLGGSCVNSILDALIPIVEKHHKNLETNYTGRDLEITKRLTEEINSGILDAKNRPNLLNRVKEKLSETVNINKILKNSNNFIMNS